MATAVFGLQLLTAAAITTAPVWAPYAVAAYSVYSGVQQSKALKQQGEASTRQAQALNKQADEQRKLANLRNLRTKRQTIREARIKRAEVVSRGEVTGTGAGSATAGETGSVGSQLGFNLSFLDTAQSFQNAAVGFGQDAALFGGAANVAGSNAAIFGNRSNIANTISPVSTAAKSIFKGFG